MKRFKAQASKPELRKVAYSSGNLAVNLLSKYRRSIKNGKAERNFIPPALPLSF